MSSNFKITSVDIGTGGLEALTKNLEKLKEKKHVQVGFPTAEMRKSEKGETPKTVVEIAFYNEYGLGVPERSFMRTAIIENRAEIKAFQGKLALRVAQGKVDQERALKLLGDKIKSLIQTKIIKLDKPIEGPQQLRKKKGVSNPLMDSSQMHNSVTYVVEDGGGEDGDT
ncbi:MAG: hypothetical protein DRJ03_03255 [Chloroflexi bacterium]|nr:MAG: hypothetical protein DRJ03_03255 [Chloroflexota bacterium]